MDPQLAKWIHWLGDVSADVSSKEAGIRKDIMELCRSRRVFNTVAQMIDDNPEIQQENVFYDVFGYCYAHAMMGGIRRHVKIDKSGQSKSLATLLNDIIERHTCLTKEKKPVLTKDYYVSLVSKDFEDHSIPELAEHMRNGARAAFDRDFAGSTGDYVDPCIVRKDLDEFRDKAASCEEYFDRRVAHPDKRALSDVPTFGMIDECIEMMDKLVSKYQRLLTGSAPEPATPVIAEDWEAIFRVPWIPPSDSS